VIRKRDGGRIRKNDEERRLWVLNDSGLYGWWVSSRVGLYRFIRENREELDRFILDTLDCGRRKGE
jgi:hypothetical protein